MHPLDEGLFRRIRTEKMIEDSTLDIESLVPARRALSHRIFKMGPQGEQNVIGIKDVSRERPLAGPAQISAGYRLVFIRSAVPPQELKTHAGVQQSLQRLGLDAELDGKCCELTGRALEQVENAKGHCCEHDLGTAEGFDQFYDQGGIGDRGRIG